MEQEKILKMNKIIFSSILLLFFSTIFAKAQNSRQFVRIGNKNFQQHLYVEAETSYRQALAKDPHNFRAIYNLGCALQQQNKDSLALQQYEMAVKEEPNKLIKSRSYHNMGVIYQQKHQFSEAIEAYKNALRNNPNDSNARYNLILCQHQNTKQKTNPQSNQNKTNKQKQPNQKEKNKNSDKNNDKNRQQQSQELSRQNAEQLLNAALQEEKETQERLKKALRQPSQRTFDKNW